MYQRMFPKLHIILFQHPNHHLDSLLVRLYSSVLYASLDAAWCWAMEDARLVAHTLTTTLLLFSLYFLAIILQAPVTG